MLIILIGYQSINGQEKYWVFLKDKKFSAVDTHDYLDQKAKNRRKKIGFPLNHYSDIPVCFSYVDEVTSKVNHVLGVSRWFNAICVTAFEEQISEIKLLPYVVEVQPLKPVLHACQLDVKNKTINNLAERQISSLEELNVIVVRTSLLGAIVLPVNVNPKTVLEEVETSNPES